MDMRWIRYCIRQKLGIASSERLWLNIRTLQASSRAKVADQGWSVSTSRYTYSGEGPRGDLRLSLSDAENTVDKILEAAGYERVTRYSTSAGSSDPQFRKSVQSEAIVVKAGRP
jgi:hypothetical protein